MTIDQVEPRYYRTIRHVNGDRMCYSWQICYIGYASKREIVYAASEEVFPSQNEAEDDCIAYMEKNKIDAKPE